MTMCPYKWCLYIGTLLGLAYIAVEAWIQYRRHGTPIVAPTPLKDLSYLDDDLDSDDEDEDEDEDEMQPVIEEEDDEDLDLDMDMDTVVQRKEICYDAYSSLSTFLPSTRSLRSRAQTLLRMHPHPIDRPST